MKTKVLEQKYGDVTEMAVSISNISLPTLKNNYRSCVIT